MLTTEIKLPVYSAYPQITNTPTTLPLEKNLYGYPCWSMRVYGNNSYAEQEQLLKAGGV